MKKLILFASLLSISLVALGCFGISNKDAAGTSSNVTGISLGSEKLLDLTLDYITQFQKENYDSFYQNVSEAFRLQVPKETFASQLAMVYMMAGKQESVLDQSAENKEGQSIVKLTTVNTLRQLVYIFVYDKDGIITGTNVQFMPLTVEPQSTDTWEEFPIQVGQDEKKLNGLLTLPKNIENPPVAILLQGSGPSNMDEKISISGEGGNKPFADIAHGLAEQGVASIRYDKRTYAYPEDCVGKGVETEYLEDAAAAVKLASKDKRVNGSEIYLVGHSEGGMLAPKISQDNKEIKGFVSLAGTLRRLEDVSLDQIKATLSLDTTMTEDEKKTYLEQVEGEISKIKELDPQDTTSVIQGIPAVYWNSLNAIDSVSIVKELTIPMLILQGEEDFQVSMEKDYTLWQETLAGKDNVSFISYPGLSHLFMPGGSRDTIDTSIYDIPSAVDKKVMEDIAKWIKTTEK